MLAKFSFANLAVWFSVVNLLKSEVVIYLLWSDILFLTAVTAVAVPKLVILGILFWTLFILALRTVVVAKLAILGVLFWTSFILAIKVVLVVTLVISGSISS